MFRDSIIILVSIPIELTTYSQYERSTVVLFLKLTQQAGSIEGARFNQTKNHVIPVSLASYDTNEHLFFWPLTSSKIFLTASNF
jgi:hypothetical protein